MWRRQSSHTSCRMRSASWRKSSRSKSPWSATSSCTARVASGTRILLLLLNTTACSTQTRACKPRASRLPTWSPTSRAPAGRIRAPLPRRALASPMQTSSSTSPQTTAKHAREAPSPGPPLAPATLRLIVPLPVLSTSAPRNSAPPLIWPRCMPLRSTRSCMRSASPGVRSIISGTRVAIPLRPRTVERSPAPSPSHRRRLGTLIGPTPRSRRRSSRTRPPAATR
mmetsp:Transcript_68669/g.217189  ORF Transcript_68669/g.217189 Transcript_68669/m.217189 type:complete len:225 (-) Transcript_68669:1196-1870(-)